MEQQARLDAQEAALDALLAALGTVVEVPQDDRVARLAERAPGYPQYHRIGHKRQAAYRRLEADRAAAHRAYPLVLAALLADDDPSSPRWLAQVLLVVGGRRRLQEELVAAVEGGDPLRQGCAVGAWRWAEAVDGPLAERFLTARRAAAGRCADPWARERLAD
ncbi:hypothetical protein [Kitasatospora cheerisanensis]|uniref:Uncharacterized protein n=1 Tax=Kitasatospora cheerisanensis KCTC 2395 TaxID=1348663 RepID=A0A066Z7C5_9ACTN|nr:hypothetical protein [Kitasatospora cheerisanensis]KDN86206.1 hypothetical protein KCH_20230 [Kitasatospora cheerisanensis KCTC 2395]